MTTAWKSPRWAASFGGSHRNRCERRRAGYLVRRAPAVAASLLMTSVLVFIAWSKTRATRPRVAPASKLEIRSHAAEQRSLCKQFKVDGEPPVANIPPEFVLCGRVLDIGDDSEQALDVATDSLGQ